MEDMDIDDVVIPDTPPDRFAARHAIRREPVEGNSVNGITLNDRFNSELGGRRLVIRPPRNPGNISTKNGRHSYVLSSGDNSSASQNAHLFRRPGMGKTSRSDAKYSSGTESMDRRESISNRVLSKSSAFPEDTEILDITEQNGHTQLRRKDFPDGKLEDVAEGRRNRQISSVSSSKDCIANRMERSRNANKGKEIDDRTLNRLDSAGSLGEGIDLSTEPQHKTGNHKTMGSHSFTLPRVSGQKRLVRNGCISPHNIAMKSKQLYEEPNNSSKNIEQSHAVNAVSSGSPYVIDVNDITVDDNKRERMKGKGVMVQSSSPEESNARVGHTLTSFMNDNNEANRTSYADKDISGCFGKEGGWRSTRNRSSTLDPFLSDSLVQRPRVNSGARNLVFQHGKRVEREDIGREGNFVNLANGLNSTQTASSLVSEPGRMAGQRHEGNRVINREKKRGSSMESHGECSTLNNGDSEILFLGSSQASESSKPSRMQRRPVIEVDELSPAAGPSAPQDANSRNDDSEARARQLEADEMLARDLQEQLYHEVPVFGGEIDEHLAWALQHEENASNTSSSRGSMRLHSHRQPQSQTSQNPSTRRATQARVSSSSTMAQLRSRVRNQAPRVSNRRRNPRVPFPSDMDLEMRLNILEALEAAVGNVGNVGMNNQMLQLQRDFNENDYEMLLALDENNHQLTGATVNQINNLPQSTVQTDASEETCAICLETPTLGDTVRHLPCLHRFHKDCIDPWLNRKTSCPICKSSIS